MATMSVTGTVTMEAPFSILSDGSDLLSPLRLVHMCDLPVWMQKDVYIRHGYRRPQASFRACVKSLFYTHNETVNIWSHLFTSAFMIGLLAWTATPAWHGGYYFAEADITALQFYLVCQTLCLWFSVSSGD